MGIFDSWSDDDKDEPYIIGNVPLGGWKPQFGKNVKSSGTTVQINAKSEPHYFMRPTKGQIRYGGKLIVRCAVSGTEGTEWKNEGQPCKNPSFRPMLRKRGDNLTASSGRFWSNPQRIDLRESGKFELIIPINSANWTNVYGKRSKTGLQELLRDIGWVGVTFGGNNNFGHGLRANKNVTVKITRFEFQ